MRKMKKAQVTICLLLVLLGANLAEAGTWTTIPDYPGMVNTSVGGISGDNIVGQGGDTRSIQYGFLYNRTTKSVTYLPISGYDIDGSNLVGYYSDGGASSGFSYDGTNWTSISLGAQSWVTGIDGSNLVGHYLTSSGVQHGLLYTGRTLTTLDYPGSSTTGITGIDGSNLVGYYTVGSPDGSGDWHGFLYNMTTQVWITLDYPGASHTSISGIDGNNLVGSYYNGHPMGPQYWHSFVYTIPEPATLLLLVLGGVFLRKR